jgi:hypothetical protein
MPMNNTPDETPLQALERFVVDNDDLLSLEALIGRFNVFDALQIVRREIVHSNFLAFLLHPAESHGQSQLFLKALLMDLLKSAPPELRPLSPIELDGTDLRGVDIRREWNRIDLLITSREPAFVVVIENKIDSSEHSDQLGRYQQTIAKHFPGARPLYVYLTRTGGEASKANWVSYSYQRIFEVLTRVCKTYEGAIGDDVLVFLKHYLNLIETHFMDNPDIDRLCKQIWKHHRQALQLIYEREGNPASGVMSDVEQAVINDGRWHVFYRAADVVDFVPKNWIDWMPPMGLDRKEQPKSWFVFRFSLYEKTLDYYVELRRMEDAALRKRIVDALLSNGEQFGFVRKQTREAKEFYTRVSGRERVIVFDGDEVPNAETTHAAVKKRLDLVYPKTAALGQFLQSLLNPSLLTR